MMKKIIGILVCILMLSMSMVSITTAQKSTTTNNFNSKSINNQVEIEIKGGIGLTITVRNLNEGEIVEWDVEFSGIVFIGINTEGSSSSTGEEFTCTIFMLGFGSGSVTVTVGEITESADFRLIGPFVRLL